MASWRLDWTDLSCEGWEHLGHDGCLFKDIVESWWDCSLVDVSYSHGLRYYFTVIPHDYHRYARVSEVEAQRFSCRKSSSQWLDSERAVIRRPFEYQTA
jgi:hypothetical protein